MILLWFILGMALAFGIARYNKSNKLFWQLAISFILGYAATVMVTRTIGNERSSENLVQVCPTQMPTIVSGNSIVYLLADTSLTPTKVTALESAVQAFTPEEHESSAISSKVFGRTRDQPTKTLTKPPECLTKVFSTHHDG